MSSPAKKFKSHLGGAVQIAPHFTGLYKPACCVFSVEWFAEKSLGFHAGRSSVKPFWLFFSRLKLMLADPRTLLSQALVVLCFLLLSGCQSGESEYIGDDLGGVNHTFDAINNFGVNGYGGGNLQPNGFGGGACCMVMPRKWRPGLKVLVDWEVDPNPRVRLPPHWSDEYDAVYKKHREGYRRYSAWVDIPEYTTEGLCSLKIHFLPCNKLKATTACTVYGSPDYPVKEHQYLRGPLACQK